MARTPNYAWERKDRDRIKAAKKAEKEAAKAATASTKPADETQSNVEE
ncbi:hypothetical protein KEU06_28745 [Pseudaminobacter sp. 19-2017]|uniref:Uncharacterized protein n=1 Tax=Pseudaminobacter soli (ex Zhang et al. 2022) TaxID=2831468 RepID=A0A942E2E4_9HYPH|nr:hypothetical protein [Pseudaminobacter soli]MBS3652569.1 hypothetical protein [Pseudaminobacter soli]